ncbi:MAG: BTAD domain-containing putative transcriptional regulator, partial [Longimicrobiales bacterium]
LLLFGGATLEGDRGPVAGRSAQRRRLALMALLAVSRRPLSRDKLIGYLWEESDIDKARRLLSESVYQIRKSLGEDVIVTNGDEIRLNPAVLWSDVEEFSDALQSGDEERAVALYKGPLLDGFFISDATEFEQWLDRERDRLGRDVAAALTRLAQRAEQRLDFPAAEQWWRRLCQHDPYGTVPALGLMRVLDAAGNRADALKYARAHASRLYDDLGADPDPQVEAFARELRSALAPSTPVRIAATVSEPARIPPDPVAETSFAEPRVPPSVQPTPALIVGPGTKRWPRRVTLALVMIAIVTTVVIMTIKPGRTDTAEKGGRLTIAVLPASNPKSDPSLANDVVQLLSINLDGAGELRAIDPHRVLARIVADRAEISPEHGARLANGFAAQMFVLVRVIPAGNHVTITASLYETANPDKLPRRAQVDHQRDSLHVMVDKLSRELLGTSGLLPGGPLRSVAAVTTKSYPALKLYFQGDEHFLASRYREAVDFFKQAVAQDSNFALAHYRLSAAEEWNFDFVAARASAVRAQRLGERLPLQQRRLIAPWVALLDGRYPDAESGYSNILSTDPHDIEALAGLAEVRVHFNPVRGLRADSALPMFDRVLDELPEFGEARFHALEFAARARNQARFDSIADRFTEQNQQSLAWNAVRAFTWGTEADQGRVLAQVNRSDEEVVGLAAGRVAAHTHNFAAAARIVTRLTQSQLPDWRAAGYLFRAQLAVASNNWTAAQRDLVQANPLEQDWTRELTALYLLHPFVNAPRARLLEEIDSLKAWKPELHQPSGTFFFGVHALVRPELKLYLQGLLSAAVHDTAQAEFYRRQLAQTPPNEVREKDVEPFARSLAQSLRGHIALAKGQDSVALQALTSSSAEIRSRLEVITISPFYARAHDRFVIAALSERLGRRDQAIRWYRSFLDSFDFVYAAPAHERLTALYSAAGDTARAREHRESFSRLTRPWR